MAGTGAHEETGFSTWDYSIPCRASRFEPLRTNDGIWRTNRRHHYAEFKGNVAFVGTKEFWRTAEESPSSQGYHWNTNAETYYLIGEAMGQAMKKLLAEK